MGNNRGKLQMNMRKQTWKAAVSAAAIAAGAAIPMAAKATTENITFTTNGVTWRVRLEPEADSYLSSYGSVGNVPGTAMLGINTSCYNITDRDKLEYKAISNLNVSVDASLIPWQFDYNGTHYTVTKIALGAFRQNGTAAKLTGTVTIPDSVTELRNSAFNNQQTLTGFSGGKNVKFWGNTTGAGIFPNCVNMLGVYPDMSQAVYVGDSIFSSSNKMTGNLVLSDMLKDVNYYAFQSTQISGTVVIPASVNTIGGDNATFGVFYNCPKLEAVWVRGKPTATSQTYTTVYAASFVRSCASMKMVLFGQNTKGASVNAMNGTQAGHRMLNGDSNVQVFVPANGYWTGLDVGGTNNKTRWYGPSEEFDLAINDTDMTATFTPTTVNALTNALSWASDFKTHFNLDAHISVTNTLDLTGVTIDSAALSGVTFDRLMFTATTQAQLNDILDTFPATTPISIDPTGLTENMVIPETYNNVHVKTVPGVTIKRTTKGFMIIVK